MILAFGVFFRLIRKVPILIYADWPIVLNNLVHSLIFLKINLQPYSECALSRISTGNHCFSTQLLESESQILCTKTSLNRCQKKHLEYIIIPHSSHNHLARGKALWILNCATYVYSKHVEVLVFCTQSCRETASRNSYMWVTVRVT